MDEKPKFEIEIEPPMSELEILRQAHGAQNEVLARMWAELVALRAENAELRAQLDNALTRLGIEWI